MRKQALLLMLLLFAKLSYGQVTLAPKAGVTFAKQRIELEKWKKESLGQKLAFSTGAVVGVGVSLPVYKQLHLQSELNYVQQGYTLTSASGYNTSETHRLSSLNVPVLAKAYLLKSAIKPYTLLGIYGGYLLSGKFKSCDFTGETTKSNIPVGKSSANYNNRYDWGLQLGAGMSYHLGKGEVNMEAKYSLGLSYAQRKYTSYIPYTTVYQEGHNGKNSVFSITVGYAVSL